MHTRQLNNRKSVLGELNWIFTAITDTIAWYPPLNRKSSPGVAPKP